MTSFAAILGTSLTFRSDRRAATLEDRMHHLETLIQAIPPAVFAASGAGASAPHSPIDPSTSPHASFAESTHIFPTAVPPPSLNSYPLMNPSTFFAPVKATRHSSPSFSGGQSGIIVVDNLTDDSARMSLSSSYLYFDDEGYTRWQGETSGLPLLDLLVERHNMAVKPDLERGQAQAQVWTSQNGQAVSDWFPDRSSKRVDNNPEAVWKLITSFIAPELMDSLVQCFLSTSYYLLPFLHVPTFLADYGNPRKWGEPGFAAFVVAVCCLSSRHIDDPRVRGDPNDGNSAGTQWFELFGRLRTLPSADRPTIYTVQGVLVAGVYAVGLGKLSKAFGLLAEAVTLSIDIGLHRSVDDYDVFDPIEDEPAETETRMSAFVSCIRMFIVLESVVDIPPPRPIGEGCSAFLARASSVLGPFKRMGDLREEEAMLDEIVRSIPPHWAHSVETMTSDDVLRVTQANRLHCAQQYVRMLIHRHRFSEMVAERTQMGTIEQTDAEVEAMRAAHACALQIISSHLHIAAKGLMTYYGVHVIHQLTAAGRTLVAVLLCCQPENMQPLIAPGLEALRSSVGLLKRFSGRYICGQRSGDLLEEFCRLTAIPLDAARNECPGASNRPAWVRPARKKTPSTARSPAHSADSPSHHSSPEDYTDAFMDLRAKSQEPNPFASNPSTQTLAQNGFGGISSFMDASNGLDLMSTDSSLPMSQSDILALLNDGTVDMTSLLMSPTLGGSAEPQGGGFYAMTPTSNGNGPVGMVSP
ncbi:hypothetical protein EVJ58_g3957 [Rhodofomes roseus]|uniref:Xylanolytic transcriptional activator regulatory domain-containing protein n=1 Tax=Rhodofomes roseus TaxID=34475 RepID=A0A4Y9YKG6_9APHY|nr:hypothetical protein EVJ58_g3957 [Rhodofomes roseus]